MMSAVNIRESRPIQETRKRPCFSPISPIGIGFAILK